MNSPLPLNISLSVIPGAAWAVDSMIGPASTGDSDAAADLMVLPVLVGLTGVVPVDEHAAIIATIIITTRVDAIFSARRSNVTTSNTVGNTENSSGLLT